MSITCVTRPTRLRAALVAATLLAGCSSGTSGRVKVDPYNLLEFAQARWQLGRPMYYLPPLPRFSAPVRIDGVSLRTVSGVGEFRPPSVQLLIVPNPPFHGEHLTYAPINTEGGTLVGLDRAIPVGGNANIRLVVSVNIGTPGCHEAQLVLRFHHGDTAQSAVLPWYVGLDTGTHTGPPQHICTP
ncbi:MAG: hypothetical protein QOC82_2073 [Frankiaceae bacterium]|nr:hypothetical protein [Frankiaceae bacterium]